MEIVLCSFSFGLLAVSRLVVDRYVRSNGRAAGGLSHGDSSGLTSDPGMEARARKRAVFHYGAPSHQRGSGSTAAGHSRTGSIHKETQTIENVGTPNLVGEQL